MEFSFSSCLVHINTLKHIHTFELVVLTSDLYLCLQSTSLFVFCLWPLTFNWKCMNSNRRFIMFFFLLPFSSLMNYGAPPLVHLVRAASKLNAVCRHATQEQTGQAGIYWPALLWPKHLYTPQCFQAQKTSQKSYKKAFVSKNIISSPFYSINCSQLKKKKTY